MLETIANTFRIPELRRRILFTVSVLALCRIGVFVSVPGVNVSALQKWLESVSGAAGGAAAQVMNFANIFAGGGLQKCAIFGLGVMPYISASIIFQLLVQVVPQFKRLSEEGEAGRKKIQQYTRYATVFLCFFQAFMLLKGLRAQGGEAIALAFPESFGFGLTFLAAVLMTGGTLLLMWMGELIDEYGIGNGISLIIMANILSRLPWAVQLIADEFAFTMSPEEGDIGVLKLAFIIVSFVAVLVGIVLITQGQRRIPFQQAKQMRGRRVYGGMKHYLPLQVNAANVIPIIFAQSLLMFPVGIASYLERATTAGGLWNAVAGSLVNALRYGSFTYTVIYVALIFFFCYFWTAITFNPSEMSKNLQEHGSFIPGIRPGRRTADYLERVMTRITLPGAAFLSLIAILPTLIGAAMQIPSPVTQFFGGTSVLIAVGVALDLVKKVEAQLLVRHYDGFTRGRKKRRF
jgi:preprotein translocase subunit SecY